MRAVYQGIRGAYSEIALRRQFGPRVRALGLALSEQVFDAVESGRADYGMLPVENTIAGNVAVNSDLFYKRKVFVIAESYLKIEHCLLAVPKNRLNDVHTVYSHPVALAQCQDFLKRLRIKAVPEYDTAGSAEFVAGRQLLGEAAISSSACAEVYGLKILKKNIQSFRNNITRFLTFTRKSKVPAGLRMEKTSLVLSTKHRPGALLSCLRRFAERKINLTRLESRPIPENPFEYVFYIDFIGGLHEKNVAQALREVKKEAHEIKIIGSYPLAAGSNRA